MELLSRFPDVAFVTTTSMQAIRVPLIKYFATYGVPLKLHTDNGPPMNSLNWKLFAKEQGFIAKFSTPKHPEANSVCERIMTTIDQAYQRSQLMKSNFKEEILNAIKAYRCTPHGNQPSPYETLFGRKMSLGKISVPNLTKQPTKQEAKVATTRRFETVADKIYSGKLKRKEKHDKKPNIKEQSGISIGS